MEAAVVPREGGRRRCHRAHEHRRESIRLDRWLRRGGREVLGLDRLLRRSRRRTDGLDTMGQYHYPYPYRERCPKGLEPPHERPPFAAGRDRIARISADRIMALGYAPVNRKRSAPCGAGSRGGALPRTAASPAATRKSRSGRPCWPHAATTVSSRSAYRLPASLSEPKLPLRHSTAGRRARPARTCLRGA